MSRGEDWSGLPAPEADGAADHLTGLTMPSLALPATDGHEVDFSGLAGWLVIYAYPKTGRADVAAPSDWHMIPGAKGCTPQSCAFRDHHAELRDLGVDHLYGLSTQATDWQSEAVERMHLPFALVSDARLRLADALRLPRFEVEGETLLRRLTLIVRDGIILRYFYPVFPPEDNAREVCDWLHAHALGS